MSRHSRMISLVLLIPLLLVLVFSCSEKTVPALLEPVDEAVPVVLPPYRMVLVSSAALPAVGLPAGMVTVLKPGAGRLTPLSAQWKALLDLIEDDEIRAVVVADAPQGTAALFAALKEARPELLLVALSPAEVPLVIQASADIVMDFDHVARAYSAAMIATRMGKNSMIALSLSEADDDWRSSTRLAVLQLASVAMDFSLKTLVVTPEELEAALRDHGIDPGMDTARGPGVPSGMAARAAIVVNNGELASEALRIAEATGALFIELDKPAVSYAGGTTEGGSPATSVGNSTSAVTGGLTAGDPVRGLIDAARNVPGRPGLTLIWPGEQSVLMELGALMFARAIVDGKPASEASLSSVMNTVWPAGQWQASHFVDSQTGVRARNHLLIGADPYLVGRSYLSSESLNMPGKYRQASGL